MSDTLDATDLDLGLSSIDAHLVCCVRERFLCGAEYHPEAEAAEDAAEEDV